MELDFSSIDLFEVPHPIEPVKRLRLNDTFISVVKGLSDTIEELYVQNTRLRVLEVPPRTRILNVSFTYIDELKLPEGLEELYCACTRLRSLHLPSTIRIVDASHNELDQMDELVIPDGCISANVANCGLARVRYSASIKHIDLSSNPL